MLSRKIYSLTLAGLNSVKHAAGNNAVNLLAVILISLVPAIANAGIPIGGNIGFGGGGISGGLNIGGLSIGGGFGSSGGGTGGIGEALCVIVDWFTVGGVGSAVASLAVIFLGIGAFFGKVTWGMALMFAAGIFSIFGASDIVAAITGGGGQACG